MNFALRSTLLHFASLLYCTTHHYFTALTPTLLYCMTHHNFTVWHTTTLLHFTAPRYCTSKHYFTALHITALLDFTTLLYCTTQHYITMPLLQCSVQLLSGMSVFTTARSPCNSCLYPPGGGQTLSHRNNAVPLYIPTWQILYLYVSPPRIWTHMDTKCTFIHDQLCLMTGACKSKSDLSKEDT